ncbi:MAG: hypothetical protein LBP24_04210 [Coriobacteriales bacterium]|jgi:hypothetical protein|nr:hypothetical protein [Coriobacteriales bacterium]
MNLEDIQNTISLLHIGFIICVILAIVFFGLSVLFFVRFNILQVIRHKTGITARKELAAFGNYNSADLSSDAFAGDNSIALGERTPVGLKDPLPQGSGTKRSGRPGAQGANGIPPGTESSGSGADLTSMLASDNLPREALPPPPVLAPGVVLVKEVLIVHTDVEI